MRKNQTGQYVSFQMISTTDGSNVTTGTPAVYYTIEGGTQGTGTGTATHEGNGQWSYAPVQAETNGNQVAFTMVLAGAVSQTINVYPVAFDPSDTVRMGLTSLPNAAADAAGGLPISDSGGLDLDAKIGALTFTVANQLDSNVKYISDDSTAADNLELMFDGTGYSDDTAPASRLQVASIGAASGGALNYEATEDNTGGAIIGGVTFVGTQTGTFANTETEDGVYHQITHATNDFDIVYGFNIGGGRTGVEVTFKGYLLGLNDNAVIQAYDHVGAGWNTIATIMGQALTENINIFAPLLSKHTGTGSEIGNVYIRIDGQGDDSSPILYTDLLNVSAVSIGQSVGYADGAIWLDTVNGTAGSEAYVNGVADNPCSTWANVLSLFTSVGVNRVRVVGGSSITLTSDSTGYQIIGNGYVSVNLGSQTVANCYLENVTISGTGTGSGFQAHYCHIAAGASLPSGDYYKTGFAGTSGSPVTPSGTGDYIIHMGFSEVAGVGTPYFDWSGTGGSTSLNNRGWTGGSNITLDSNNTLSQEVLAGGGQTITTGGADVEIRAASARAVTVVMSGTETVQIVGVVGPIGLSGTTTATVNIYGVHGTITNTTSAATVTDNGVNASDVGDILADSSELQTNQGNWATATGFATPTNITAGTITTVSGNVSGSVGSVTGAVGSVTGNVGGIAGTLNTLDDLDTAQDAQHAATQNLVDDLAIKKNTSGVLHFEMVLASDHVTPATGIIVTAQRLIDSGTYASVGGTITEISNGTYRFDYVAADSNGDMITWKFSEGTADDTKITFKTIA